MSLSWVGIMTILVCVALPSPTRPSTRVTYDITCHLSLVENRDRSSNLSAQVVCGAMTAIMLPNERIQNPMAEMKSNLYFAPPGILLACWAPYTQSGHRNDGTQASFRVLSEQTLVTSEASFIVSYIRFLFYALNVLNGSVTWSNENFAKV